MPIQDEPIEFLPETEVDKEFAETVQDLKRTLTDVAKQAKETLDTALKHIPRQSVFFMQPTANEETVRAAVKDLCTYHPWTKDEQLTAGKAVVAAIEEAMVAIVKNVPSCPNRSLALQHLVDARMRANAAITFEGRY